jgi:hypothetical protein
LPEYPNKVCLVNNFYLFAIIVPQGKLIVHRQVLKKAVDWKNSTKKIRKCVVSAKGTIEDSDAELHADFANEYIGGDTKRI